MDERTETPPDRDVAEEKAPAEPAEPKRRVPLYRRPAVLAVVGVLAVALVVGAVLYFRHAARYESTDDAFLDAHVVPVAAQVAGQVSRVLVQDNARVHAGDVLVELDPRDFQIAKQRAAAELAAAKARVGSTHATLGSSRARVAEARSKLRGARVSADLAQADLRRAKQLAASGAEPQNALDRAQARARAAAATVDAASSELAALRATLAESKAAQEGAAAGLSQAQAALKKAELALSRTKIVADTDGHVTDKSVEAGGFVGVGQTLLSIVEDRVWVTANFKETDLAELRRGQPVSISIDAYSRAWPGHVESFQRGTGTRFSLLPVENATGNYVKVVQRVPVKIVFDEQPDSQRYVLAPGMSVVPTVNVAGTPERRRATPRSSPRAVSER